MKTDYLPRRKPNCTENQGITFAWNTDIVGIVLMLYIYAVTRSPSEKSSRTSGSAREVDSNFSIRRTR